jgi:hypothetical protein
MSQQNKYWDAIIDQYKASGLSQPDFCKQNELSCNQFQYRWYQHNCAEKAKAKLATRENSASLSDFESVTISAPIPAHSTQKEVCVSELMIYLPNKINCAVKMDFRTNGFATLLKQLVALC